jgi:hypothetical protein
VASVFAQMGMSFSGRLRFAGGGKHVVWMLHSDSTTNVHSDQNLARSNFSLFLPALFLIIHIIMSFEMSFSSSLSFVDEFGRPLLLLHPRQPQHLCMPTAHSVSFSSSHDGMQSPWSFLNLGEIGMQSVCFCWR